MTVKLYPNWSEEPAKQTIAPRTKWHVIFDFCFPGWSTRTAKKENNGLKFTVNTYKKKS